MRIKGAIALGLTAIFAAAVGWHLFHRESYYQGHPTSYWVRKALTGDQSQSTITALEHLGPEAILPLLKAVVKKDPLLREAYIQLFWRFPAILQQHLSLPEPGQKKRDNAYLILNLLSIKGPKSKELVPELTKLVASDDQRPSTTFVDATTSQALPHGIYVRAVAADMLADIGPDAAPAVPVLIQRLGIRAKNDYFYDRIPRALGFIGPSTKAAIPALRNLLSDGQIDSALWAGEALWKIEPSQEALVVPVVEKGLQSTNAYTRVKAARVHWRIKAEPSVVMPVLLGLLRDKENHWMIDTMRTLEEMGPQAKEAIPALAEKLNDPDAVVRQVAAEVRGKIEAARQSP